MNLFDRFRWCMLQPGMTPALRLETPRLISGRSAVAAKGPNIGSTLPAFIRNGPLRTVLTPIKPPELEPDHGD